MAKATQGHHYYATAFWGWAVAPTKEEAVEALRRRGGKLAEPGVEAGVVRVELPQTAAYSIRWGYPVDVPMGDVETVTF